MLRDITVGQYYPTTSFVHKLDPRFKILCAFAYITSLFIVDALSSYLIVLGFLSIAVHFSKVPVKFMLRGLKPIMFIIIFAFAINMFLTPGEILVQFGILKITLQGIRQALFMAFRLIFLILGTSLLTLSTSPIELTDGLERLLGPFKKLVYLLMNWQ